MGQDPATHPKRSKLLNASVAAATVALLAVLGTNPASGWEATLARLPSYKDDELANAASEQPDALVLENSSAASATALAAAHRSHSSHSSHSSHVSGVGHSSHFSSSGGGAPPPAPPSPPKPAPPSTPPPTTPGPVAPTPAPAAVARTFIHPVEFSTKTIVDELASRPQYKAFAARAVASGLCVPNATSNPNLLLVPSPPAFEALVQAREKAEKPAQSEATLAEIIKYHVVTIRPAAEQLERGCVLKTANGQGVWIQPKDTHLTLNQRPTVKLEIRCTDGSVYVLDDVLLPSTLTLMKTLRADPKFSLFVTALEAVDAADVLDRPWLFTVFAPTDEAIRTSLGGAWLELIKPEHADELRRFVLRHLVAGRVFSDDLRAGQAIVTGDAPQTVTIEGTSIRIGAASLEQVNLNATNGVIHVLGRPLWP